MAARPEDRLEWATDTFFEVRDLGRGDGELAYANKFPVPEQVQRTGFKVRQDWYRPFINTIFNNINRSVLTGIGIEYLKPSLPCTSTQGIPIAARSSTVV